MILVQSIFFHFSSWLFFLIQQIKVDVRIPNPLDWANDFFLDEINRWLFTSASAIVAFFIVNGRWRKEQFLKVWRKERIAFVQRAEKTENHLEVVNNAIAKLLGELPLYGQADWGVLFKTHIPPSLMDWDASGIATHGFGPEIMDSESFEKLGAFTSFSRKALAMCMIAAGSSSEEQLGHHKATLRAIMEVNQQIKKLHADIRSHVLSLDYWYAGLLPLSLNRLLLPYISKLKYKSKINGIQISIAELEELSKKDLRTVLGL